MWRAWASGRMLLGAPQLGLQLETHDYNEIKAQHAWTQRMYPAKQRVELCSGHLGVSS